MNDAIFDKDSFKSNRGKFAVNYYQNSLKGHIM